MINTDANFKEIKDAAREKKDGPRAQELDEFLRFVAQKSGVISYDNMLILWPMICSSMLEWMIRKNQSVDMGFAILHPCPYRGNWKQILLNQVPTLGSAIRGKCNADREAVLALTQFNARLHKAELLALASDRLVTMGIEVEYKRSWWKTSFREEWAYYKSIGAVSYAKRISAKIGQLQKKLTASYFSWLRSISFPCAKVVYADYTRQGILVPYVPSGKVRAARFEDIPVHAVVSCKQKEVINTLQSLDEEDSVLQQEVFDIRQEFENLRNIEPGRIDLDKPPDQP